MCKIKGDAFTRGHPYDYLVIGLGAVPETFGIKGLKEFAFPIANINTSRQLKEHIELQFATYNTEAEKRPDRLTIVVGGRALRN